MSASSEYDTETQTGIVTVSVDEDKLRTALSDPDGAGANAVQWMKPSDANYADILAYGFTITAILNRICIGGVSLSVKIDQSRSDHDLAGRTHVAFESDLLQMLTIRPGRSSSLSSLLAPRTLL